MSYIYHMGVMVNIYIILALSLNLIIGVGGMVSLCHAALYGIGAYIGTLALVNLEWSFVNGGRKF